MTKTIQLRGSGGAAGIGMTRCLKEHYTVEGCDESVWSEAISECEEITTTPDLIIPIPDSLVRDYSNERNHPLFLPSREQIKLCQDKAKTAHLLQDLAPEVYWVRNIEGAGGKGAQMASEVLPGRNFSQEFVFFEGKELVSFQKQRISYSLKKKTTGLENVGSSMVSICTSNEEVKKVALNALKKVGEHTSTLLHGFYGVDLVENNKGVPKVTEVNAGRLLTASYSYFYLTGYNLPLVGVKAFFGEELPILPDYPVGYGLLRQVDCKPRLVTPDTTKDWEKSL